jgi:hypothetical protein
MYAITSFTLQDANTVIQSSDTVEGMIHYEMNAMFMYTVTTGLVGALMSWEILVLSIKGWALLKEKHKMRH